MPKKIKFESYKYHFLTALNNKRKASCAEEAKKIDALIKEIKFTYISGSVLIEIDRAGLNILEPLDKCIFFKKNNVVEDFIGDSNCELNKNYFNDCIHNLLKKV